MRGFSDTIILPLTRSSVNEYQRNAHLIRFFVLKLSNKTVGRNDDVYFGVDSVHGRGSTFWFKFPTEALENEGGAEDVVIPRVEAEPKVKKKKALADFKETPDGLFSKFSVLIVDDHPVNILFAQKLMKKLGFGHKTEGGKFDAFFDCAPITVMPTAMIERFLSPNLHPYLGA